MILLVDVAKLRALVESGALAPADQTFFDVALKEYDEIEAEGSPAGMWLENGKLIVGVMQPITRQ